MKVSIAIRESDNRFIVWIQGDAWQETYESPEFTLESKKEMIPEVLKTIGFILQNKPDLWQKQDSTNSIPNAGPAVQRD